MAPSEITEAVFRNPDLLREILPSDNAVLWWSRVIDKTASASWDLVPRFGGTPPLDMEKVFLEVFSKYRTIVFEPAAWTWLRPACLGFLLGPTIVTYHITHMELQIDWESLMLHPLPWSNPTSSLLKLRPIIKETAHILTTAICKGTLPALRRVCFPVYDVNNFHVILRHRKRHAPGGVWETLKELVMQPVNLGIGAMNEIVSRYWDVGPNVSRLVEFPPLLLCTLPCMKLTLQDMVRNPGVYRGYMRVTTTLLYRRTQSDKIWYAWWDALRQGAFENLSVIQIRLDGKRDNLSACIDDLLLHTRASLVVSIYYSPGGTRDLLRGRARQHPGRFRKMMIDFKTVDSDVVM